MKHIKQQSTVDCVIAALATVLGVTYDDVLKTIPFSPFSEFVIKDKHGQDARVPYSFMADEIITYLALQGVQHVRLHTTNFFAAYGPQEMNRRFSKGHCLLPTQEQVKELLNSMGIPAILIVEPWIDEFVEHHAVVYDPASKDKYFDPHLEHNDNVGMYGIEECLIYQVVLVPGTNAVRGFDFNDTLKRNLAIVMEYLGGTKWAHFQ